MLLLPIAFCTPVHKHECDLNIEGVDGANVIVCYNICDRNCSLTKVKAKITKDNVMVGKQVFLVSANIKSILNDQET